jgi:hypothetical protein
MEASMPNIHIQEINDSNAPSRNHGADRADKSQRLEVDRLELLKALFVLGLVAREAGEVK